jgi:GntR family transcriptional regulator
MSSSRIPKYLEIKTDLLARIQRKEFTAGQALPSQATLSREYGVTLMTLRQALRSLEDDGMIVQMRGRGTFVAPGPPILDLRSLSSLAEDMRAQGIDLTTQVLAQAMRPMTKQVAAALDREPGEPGLRLERLRRMGRRAVVHQVSWVPRPWAEEVLDVDFTSQSLYESLRDRCSLLVSAAVDSIRARPMPRATARAAGLTPGRATMVADRTTYDTTDAPIVYDHAVILSEEVRVLVRRTQRDVRLSWSAGISTPPTTARSRVRPAEDPRGT